MISSLPVHDLTAISWFCTSLSPNLHWIDYQQQQLTKR
jgi:hypothetical protein